jgi:putative redox protein
MRTQRLDFPGAHGHTLSARLDQPEEPPRAYALFAHCFTCGKDIKAASRIAGALAEEGIATLRFDFTGLGGSEGDFGNTGFHSNVADLVAAARFMRESGWPVSILVGHSLGGAAVIAAAGEIPECRAVCAVGAPFQAEHILEHLGDKRETIETEGEAEVTLGGRPFRIGRAFIEETLNQDQATRIANLRRPLLILHAPLDGIVPVDNARRIFETARHPKSFVSLDDADHLLTGPSDARYAATVIAAWAARYLDAPGAPEGTSAGLAPVEGVEVAETGSGRFQQRVRAGRHAMLADEPETSGGNGTGPTPYDLLLAALGTCTSMTLRMYAQHKGLPLNRVSVRLAHEKVHAEDCARCEHASGRVDRITRWVYLEGDLSAEQRQRLIQIADRCPVHQTLHGQVEVHTGDSSEG